MRWPWQRRAEKAKAEADRAAQEREEATRPLVEHAREIVRESARHRRDNHFRQAIEELMRRGA